MEEEYMSHSKLMRVSIAMLAFFFAMSVLAAQAGAFGRKHKKHRDFRPRNETVIVLPEDLQLPPDVTTTQDTWYFYDDNTDTPSTTELPGSYEFVNDNGSDSNGSVEFNVADGERWNLATNQLAGTELDDMKKLKFDMFTPSSSSGGTDTTLFANFDVDFDNTSAGTRHLGNLGHDR
jgi:hypothetical protein